MGTDPFGSLSFEHASTVDRVADELRRAVFDGELEPGTPLREVALADSLGVARSTIREALSLLVVEGIALREPNRGVQVASPDPGSIRDVMRARTILELAGIRNWNAADEATRDAVRRALVDYTTAVRAGATVHDLNEKHLAIHLTFVGLLGSPRLVAMAESLGSELKLALAQTDRVRRNSHDQAGSHNQLLGLLERGDVDGAAAEIQTHLADAEAAMLAALSLRPR